MLRGPDGASLTAELPCSLSQREDVLGPPERLSAVLLGPGLQTGDPSCFPPRLVLQAAVLRGQTRAGRDGNFGLRLWGAAALSDDTMTGPGLVAGNDAVQSGRWRGSLARLELFFLASSIAHGQGVTLAAMSQPDSGSSFAHVGCGQHSQMLLVSFSVV